MICKDIIFVCLTDALKELILDSPIGYSYKNGIFQKSLNLADCRICDPENNCVQSLDSVKKFEFVEDSLVEMLMSFLLKLLKQQSFNVK